MVQSTSALQTSSNGSSAREREAGRVEQPMNGNPEAKAAERGRNNPAQVEQDNRVDKARADAEAAGGGPDTPEDGLNQDG